jgi:hypothetical protein
MKICCGCESFITIVFVALLYLYALYAALQNCTLFMFPSYLYALYVSPLDLCSLLSLSSSRSSRFSLSFTLFTFLS